MVRGKGDEGVVRDLVADTYCKYVLMCSLLSKGNIIIYIYI